ncbi:hypothetical protein ACC755_21275 [Rhizobium ruizarguesonis]|uniref:hypothetical protein n=1 Tax=Rhizobium TaxID=379 RepID=UPI0010306996|nr:MULTISPECIES: hypothetical protein [Rhizobium]MBY2961688.1 hypothetical protein [Rhizobium leguminosarum]TAY93608.1 hypothetical protein ELH85_10715 [Rhizobium ruizarguesonis]
MTYQRPAYEEVTIAHGGSTVTLRPSLRAAMTLEARHGFPALYRALDDLNLTIISEIILTGSINRQDAAAFLFSQSGKPLFPFFVAVRQPLVELISMLTPAPYPKAQASSGKPLTWAEAYTALYEYATGWLGWTPDTAWNATPTEIDRAYAAHIDRLETTGVLVRDKQPATHDPVEEITEEQARAGLAKLKANAKRGKQ